MFIKKIINTSRVKKRIIVIFSDIVLSIISTYLALVIRYGYLDLSNEIDSYSYFLLPIIIFTPLFYIFRLYNSILRFIGINSLKNFFLAGIFYGCILSLILLVSPIYIFPKTLGIVQPLIFFVLVLFSRIFAFHVINFILESTNKKNILIYGTDDIAVKTADTLMRSSNFSLIGFIDPFEKNIGNIINNKKIYNLNNLDFLVHKHKINSILITTKKNNLNNIPKDTLLIFEKHNLDVKYLPDVDRFISGEIFINDFKQFELIDLIDRKIEYNGKLILNMFSNKCILITGAGGSIGSELSMQILFNNPRKLVLLDSNELSLYSLEQKINEIKLRNNFQTEVKFELASIRDKKRINYIFDENLIDFVYHAAAYKHVPMLEKNILESITNNIFGSINIINASVNNNIEQFVLISSDKAVRPTNIMGASKRVVEMLVQTYSKNKNKNKFNSKMSIVRFGNVLDSSGSVLPLFRNQIKNKQPITVTDPDVTRYFMTIPEAVNLIIQTNLLHDVDGEVFVLDMGESVKILDLAKRVIALSGLVEKNEKNPDGDIEIKFIGLRPGEKLHEELVLGNNLEKTNNPQIYRAIEETLSENELEQLIKDLELSVDLNDKDKIVATLSEKITGFKKID